MSSPPSPPQSERRFGPGGGGVVFWPVTCLSEPSGPASCFPGCVFPLLIFLFSQYGSFNLNQTPRFAARRSLYRPDQTPPALIAWPPLRISPTWNCWFHLKWNKRVSPDVCFMWWTLQHFRERSNQSYYRFQTNLAFDFMNIWIILSFNINLLIYFQHVKLFLWKQQKQLFEWRCLTWIHSFIIITEWLAGQ